LELFPDLGHRPPRAVGSGHRIVAPRAMAAEAVDAVVVMNPVYVAEVKTELHALGLDPAVVAVDQGAGALAGLPG
jgi:hypothetical protein